VASSFSLLRSRLGAFGAVRGSSFAVGHPLFLSVLAFLRCPLFKAVDSSTRGGASLEKRAFFFSPSGAPLLFFCCGRNVFFSPGMCALFLIVRDEPFPFEGFFPPSPSNTAHPHSQVSFAKLSSHAVHDGPFSSSSQRYPPPFSLGMGQFFFRGHRQRSYVPTTSFFTRTALFFPYLSGLPWRPIWDLFPGGVEGVFPPEVFFFPLSEQRLFLLMKEKTPSEERNGCPALSSSLWSPPPLLGVCFFQRNEESHRRSFPLKEAEKVPFSFPYLFSFF